MVLNVHRNHKRLIRDGEKEGKGVWTEVGVEGDYILYLSLHCHHQNDSCTD